MNVVFQTPAHGEEVAKPDRAAREMAVSILVNDDGIDLTSADRLARFIAFGEIPNQQEPTK